MTARSKPPAKIRHKRLPTVSRRELMPDGTDNDFRAMIHNLLSVAHHLQANRTSHAGMLGITGIQYTIVTAIAHLQGTDGVAINTIAQRLLLTPSFITMETAKLVSRGIVQKRTDDRDRRRVKLMLSAQGWQLLDDIVPIQQPVNDMLFDGISTQQFLAFSETIALIARNSERAKDLLAYLKHSMKERTEAKGRG
jgi:DNA-binding MarR family transcriptional regulator